MKIAIGCDHAGFELKESLKRRLEKKEIMVTDMGTDSADSVDYPDYVHPVAEAVEKNNVDFGVLICGSGNGVCMTANKHNGIRAALAWKVNLASLARKHNNANILCIPARFVSNRMAYAMVDSFLESSFEGGRHERRVNKIPC